MSGDGYAWRRMKSRIMFSLAGCCAAISVGFLLLILGYLFVNGISSVNGAFLTRLPAPVGETGGGIANAILGSVKVVGLAALMGVPVGILGGIYLAEFGTGTWAGFSIRYAADILNGLPSIVIGIFAYVLVVLPMRKFSAFSGAVALAVILIPIVLRTTEEFIRLVPDSVREAALALGIPRWKTILRVVLPAAAKGILTGVILSVSRVAGETAPLLFTAFGNQFWDRGLFEPIATLPLAIFTYAISPYDEWHRMAWAAAFILILVVMMSNVIARAIMGLGRARGAH
ncbi:MAG: phosphate ABC transporter permease PstA [Planctomycetota bacterium]